MYVVGGRGYLPVHDQQLTDSTSMQPNFVCEQEKSIERVHQWIAQQHKFAGVPPPEEEPSALFRSQSTVDITKDISSVSDSPFIDWLPIYISEELTQPVRSNAEEVLKFTGLELNRFYSPDLTRRRRYIPCSDPTLNTIKHGANNRNNLIPLRLGHNNGDTRGSPIPCPAIGNYLCRSGEGNTFPRRRKLNDKTHQRNLFSLSTMGQRQSNIKLFSYDERVIPNPCLSSHQSNTESIDQIMEDQPTSLNDSRSFLLNGANVAVTQDVNSVDKNSSLIGNLSLDTQRFLSGNLVDAKAIHKREVFNILPKYKMGKKCGYNHVRMSSDSEVTYLNGCHSQKNLNESKRTTCEIRKVKAFSWPKRAVLPSYTNSNKDELMKNNTPMKTESGYNTEKSEDKNDIVIVDNEEFNQCIDRNSSSEESDQSDLPPARPPLPSQKSYCDTNLLSSDVQFKSSTTVDHHSNVGNVALGKTSDTCHQYTGIKYLRGKERSTDYNASGFCSSTDLTRNVSMSLKDLIRIHEQEIARVSGVGSSRLKGIDVMHEKPRKTSIVDPKGRNKSIWKRHTTIGLLTNFNNLEKEKDIIGHSLDKSSIHPNFPDNEGDSSSEKSSVLYRKPFQIDNDSSLCSPSHSCAKRSIKRNGPITLPKPSRDTLNSVIEPSVVGVVKHNNVDIISTNMLTSVKCPSYVDACIQTDLVLLGLGEDGNNHSLILANEKKEMQNKFEKEKQIMHKKLEEQKKVANAYQKLEDRYRRKVYDLQKALHTCTCSKDVAVKEDIRLLADASYSHATVLFQDNDDISVQKVDSILHQLEAWLNNQTNGIHTDTSEFSSLIGSTNEEPFPRYRLTPEHYTSPPLEIIDQIDATSV